MKLSDADILRLLPEHISGDAQFSAAGQAANKTLAAISKAIPNLLIWARRLPKAVPGSTARVSS